jgi:hypothetical protein
MNGLDFNMRKKIKSTTTMLPRQLMNVTLHLNFNNVNPNFNLLIPKNLR